MQYCLISLCLGEMCFPDKDESFYAFTMLIFDLQTMVYSQYEYDSVY